MKGIVFREFLELVENSFGLDTVEDIIEKSNLPSKGAYTTIGTYDFSEMLSLINNLSDMTEMSVNDLLYIYGLHFFDILQRDYRSVLSSYKDPIELLSSVESHIHVEVKKIYPDAELPRFEVLDKTEISLNMIYYSSRSMYSFAYGLMEKAFKFYNQQALITYDLLKDDGSEVKFEIFRNV